MSNASQMTRQELIDGINALVNEFIGGCGPMHGIKRQSKDLLEQRFVAYTLMLDHHRAARLVLDALPNTQKIAWALSDDDVVPQEVKDAWAHRTEAMAIWRMAF